MTHGGMAACRFLLVRPLAFSGFNGPMPSGVQRQFTAISNAWKGSGWEWFRCGPRRGSPEKSGRRRTHAHPQQNRRRSESLRSSRAPPRQPHGPALDRTPGFTAQRTTPTMRSTTATGPSATSWATSPQSCRTHSDGPSRQLPANSSDEPGRPLDRRIRRLRHRVKTDARDARHLARLLHLGEIVAVTIPSIEQEAARDLVRAREDCRGDLMSAVATAIPCGSSAHSSPNSA